MIPFHQFQRYKMTEICFDLLRHDNSSPLNILEVGANQHKNLLNFLPNDNLTFLDLTLPDHLRDDPQFVEGDATKLIYPDNCFDYVIALDVYEHIPPHRRELFIKETFRVSKFGVFFSAPFNNGYNERAEQRISSYFYSLYGEETEWQKEHQEHGLPLLSDTLDRISSLNIEPIVIPHGSTIIWEKFIRMELTTRVHSTALSYWQELNKYYNEDLFYKDFDNIDPVRSFIIMPKYEKTGTELSSKIQGVKKQISEKDWHRIFDLEQSFYNLLQVVQKLPKPNQLDRRYCQLFYDCGEGFEESQSSILTIPDEQKTIEALFIIQNEPIKQLRFDPINSDCLIRINEISGRNKNGSLVKLELEYSNADFKYRSNILLFNNEDPQIYISRDINDLVEIKITYNIILEDLNLPTDMINILKINQNKETELLNDIEKLNLRVKEITDDRNRLENENSLLTSSKVLIEEELEQEKKINSLVSTQLEDIQSSIAWKTLNVFKTIFSKKKL